MTPPPCPGGPRYRHARAAKATAYNAEPDRRKRPVCVKCDDGHHHLVARDPKGPNA
jgi:hypothetical protein